MTSEVRLQGAPVRSDAVEAAGPLFTFVHASDLHLGRQHDPHFDLAALRAEAFFAAVRSGPRPDWLVISGDLTSLGTVDPGELAAVRAHLDALDLPYDVLPGNHDLCPSPAQAAKSPGVERYEHAPLEQTAYAGTFGVRGLRFRHQGGGIDFLGVTLRDGDPDGELAKLAADLHRAGPARARVVVGHYPSRPVRGGGSLLTWGPGHIGATAGALDELLAAHGPEAERPTGVPPVVAYLFGHVHILCAARHAGVWHMTPGALAAGCPGHRVCEVHADRIEVRFVPLSDPSLAAPGFWGGHPTDALHPDPITYHTGTPQERTFAIPLP